MIKKKANSTKYRSRLSAAIHETAAGLHRIGLMDKATMRVRAVVSEGNPCHP